MTIPQPLYLQTKGYPARLDRQFIGDIFSPGTASSSALAVTPGAGTRQVSVAAGASYVKGKNTNQGTYRVFSDAAITLTHDVATTLPRIDQIIVRVYDSTETGGAAIDDRGAIEIVKGVEASGATLANRTGAVADGSMPDNWLRLADVLIQPADGVLAGGRIGDRRVQASVKPYFNDTLTVAGTDPALNVEGVASSLVRSHATAGEATVRSLSETARATMDLDGATSAVLKLRDRGAASGRRMSHLATDDGTTVLNIIDDAGTGVLRTPWAIDHATGRTTIKAGSVKFDQVQLLKDAAGNTLIEVFKGAAESTAASGDAPATIRLPAGDIINIRNVQGGIYVPGNPSLLNLDLGAGAGDSAPGNGSGNGKRGNIGINYDVGCGVVIWDGRAPEGGTNHKVACFNETNDNTNGDALIKLYRPVTIRDETLRNQVALNTGLRTDANPGFQILGDGTHSWGPGVSGLDLTLHRFSAGHLKVDQSFDVGGDLLLGGNSQFNGNVNVGGTFTNPSDERLKENMESITGALEAITSLQGVTFEWTEESLIPVSGRAPGLIAQEVAVVFPELVSQYEGVFEDQMSVNYIGMIPWIIEALKELALSIQVAP